MSQPLYLAFVWHMHQPYYRDRASGECRMPWVRLHGTKDYLDMVELLRDFPSLHQTFNLVPSLVDQLEEYLAPQHRSDRGGTVPAAEGVSQHGGAATDRILDLSRKPAADLSDQEKREILSQFFMANWDRMIRPHARYHDLFAKRGVLLGEADLADAVSRFKTQDFLDLQVWFNLVWIDPWLRRQHAELGQLEAKGSGFSEGEKQQVLDCQLALLQRIIPAYRDAQARGQVELTTSPYYHPIMPLVCDLKSAHVALPQMVLPEESFRHPEDARWHLRQGIRRHEAAFGCRPSGVWPPEGSVSEALVQLALEEGVRWIATDEEILWRTLKTTRSPSLLYRPHAVRREAGSLAVIFRDRELSDLLGFVYSQWEASAAVQDFLKRLGVLYERFRDAASPALVSIILDGENAWEFYPEDGQPFLRMLYEALARDDRFRVVTVSEFLAQHPPDPGQSLPELSAGSWIDGNFATWIGHPEKNTAWTHLARVRQNLVESGKGNMDPAWQSFYAAEGSDWMWWFGDTHSSAQDEEFDRLFRVHLMNVYHALGQPVPMWLQVPIKTKSLSLLQEPTAPITPTIDGRDTTYYEWLYAGRLDFRKGYAAIHRSRQALQLLQYGCDREQVYLRFDVDAAALAAAAPWQILIEVPDQHARMTIAPAPGSGAHAVLASSGGTHPLPCAYQRIVELAVPGSLLGIQPANVGAATSLLHLQVKLLCGADVVEAYPVHGVFRIPILRRDQEVGVWSA